MTDYISTHLDLSRGQKAKVLRAVKKGNPVSISIKRTHGGATQLPLTKTQNTKYHKLSEGKGMRLNLSKTQLEEIKSGGFLQFLLPLLTAALMPVAKKAGEFVADKGPGLAEDAFKGIKKLVTGKGCPSGEGLRLPGGRGLNLPGAKNPPTRSRSKKNP